MSSSNSTSSTSAVYGTPESYLAEAAAALTIDARVKNLTKVNRAENHYRELFAQDREHADVSSPLTHLVSVFKNQDSFNFATVLPGEDDIPRIFEKGKEPRSPGTPAVVNRAGFSRNFGIFSEDTLRHMDWTNVFAAGGSVLACLLNVPPKHNKTRQTIRHYYHDVAYSKSDIDLFIYGLDEDAAREKLTEIYNCVCEALPFEVIAFRTPYTVSLVSQHPFRHIQIVLRLYKSPAEILMGFDVDACSVGYDGSDVWCTPRAHNALTTKANRVDLSRRSTTYEMRLAKYADRGFEVHVPSLDRTRIDPQIFERRFDQVQGLARLLLLEKLGSSDTRQLFRSNLASEKQRRAVDRNGRSQFWDQLSSNLIDDECDFDVGPDGGGSGILKSRGGGVDWSDYSTVFIPWSVEWPAKRIRKLMYQKDMIMNSKWYNPSQKHHTHPCFFGTMSEVLEDCCGRCPPIPEDAANPDKVYVTGALTWIKDDPGRQSIGSFHPITEGDWSEGTYFSDDNDPVFIATAIDDVGTIKLALDRQNNRASSETKVKDEWEIVTKEGEDKDAPTSLTEIRDAAGRTLLHLAALCNSVKVCQVLVDAGASLSAPLFDGRNALHLAIEHGHIEVARILLEANRIVVAEMEKKEARAEEDAEKIKEDDSLDDDDFEEVDSEEEDSDNDAGPSSSSAVVAEGKEEEDIRYQKDWDSSMMPAHSAILFARLDCLKLLIEFGTNVLQLLNVKQESRYSANTTYSYSPLALAALHANVDSSVDTATLLLEQGASSAQPDAKGNPVLRHLIKDGNIPFVKLMLEKDPLAKVVINAPISVRTDYTGYRSVTVSAVALAAQGNIPMLTTLLEGGGNPSSSQDDNDKWDALKARFDVGSSKSRTTLESVTAPLAASFHCFQHCAKQIQSKSKDSFETSVNLCQSAVECLRLLLEAGASADTLVVLEFSYWGKSEHTHPLDMIDRSLKSIKDTRKAKIVQNEEYEEMMNGKSDESDDDTVDHKETPVKEGGVFEYLTSRDASAKLKLTSGIVFDPVEAKKSLNKTLKALDAQAALYRVVQEMFEKHGGTRLQSETEKASGKAAKKKKKTSGLKKKSKPPTYELLARQSVHDCLNDKYAELFEASWSGDVDAINRITSAVYSPPPSSSSGEVCRSDGVDTSKLSMSRHVVVACKHVSSGVTPLSVAVFRGHADCVQRLIAIAEDQYALPFRAEEKKKKKHDGDKVTVINNFDLVRGMEDNINIGDYLNKDGMGNPVDNSPTQTEVFDATKVATKTDEAEDVVVSRHHPSLLLTMAPQSYITLALPEGFPLAPAVKQAVGGHAMVIQGRSIEIDLTPIPKSRMVPFGVDAFSEDEETSKSKSKSKKMKMKNTDGYFPQSIQLNVNVVSLAAILGHDDVVRVLLDAAVRLDVSESVTQARMEKLMKNGVKKEDVPRLMKDLGSYFVRRDLAALKAVVSNTKILDKLTDYEPIQNDLVSSVLKRGRNLSALEFAVVFGHVGVVDTLLEYGGGIEFHHLLNRAQKANLNKVLTKLNAKQSLDKRAQSLGDDDSYYEGLNVHGAKKLSWVSEHTPSLLSTKAHTRFSLLAATYGQIDMMTHFNGPQVRAALTRFVESSDRNPYVQAALAAGVTVDDMIALYFDATALDSNGNNVWHKVVTAGQVDALKSFCDPKFQEVVFAQKPSAMVRKFEAAQAKGKTRKYSRKKDDVLDARFLLNEPTPQNLRTALHLAATFSDAKCLPVLLDAGADVDAVDVNGCNIMHCAMNGTLSKDGAVQFVKVLQERLGKEKVAALFEGTPSSRSTTDGQTPWILSCRKGSAKFLRELVKVLGAEPAVKESTDGFGKSVLHYLAEDGSKDAHGKIVKMLGTSSFAVQHALLTQENGFGVTPVDVARGRVKAALRKGTTLQHPLKVVPPQVLVGDQCTWSDDLDSDKEEDSDTDSDKEEEEEEHFVGVPIRIMQLAQAAGDKCVKASGPRSIAAQIHARRCVLTVADLAKKSVDGDDGDNNEGGHDDDCSDDSDASDSDEY